ncbi:MAG: preprotein translocase subunit SecG [Boseongicola sp.]
MENVILIVHLIIALCLIGVVLLQRSEGGGLGLGGGGGGGLVSGRSAATALGKVTWLFAIGFIATSMTLTIIAAQKSASGSVLDRIGIESATGSDGTPELPSGDALLPSIPSEGDGGTLDLPTAD